MRVKQLIWALSLFCLVAFANSRANNGDGKARLSIYVFYAQDCEDCKHILTDFFLQIEPIYGDRLQVRYFEVNNPDNYQVLINLEEVYKKEENEFPVFVIGDYLLSNQEVEEKLAQVLSQYSAAGIPFSHLELTQGGVYTSIPIWEEREMENPPKGQESRKVYLAYFYKFGCKECDRAEYQIKYLERKYPNLVVRKFNIQDAESKRLAEALGEVYKIPEAQRMSTPEAFIGEDYLLGKEVSDKNLERLIGEYKDVGTRPPWEMAGGELKRAERKIISRFKGLEITTVISAGLLDGVNPCAFVTIVFFISYLAFVGRKGKELLAVGFTFTSAVFITYFLVGLGLLKFVQSLSFMPIVARIVYILTAAGALVLAVLSFYDYAKYRESEYGESILKLPDFLHRRIHQAVRTRSRAKNYVFAALVTGFFISLLEFACTGQVYLPTIIFVTKVPALKAKALFYLFFYNLCFILPLVIIFLLAYKGMTSEKLTEFFKKRGKGVKLGMGMMFLCLAGILLYYIL